ncbi:MAG: phytanoyl-CoA dioxygenase family protein [Chloroflexi bacterium]|nr:phytanoyl-CoA dioxygenase family protein [Chloroflexota bacterium]
MAVTQPKTADAMTPAEQKAFYEDQGYLVFPQMLSAEELAAARAALAEVLEESVGLTENNEKFSVTRGDDGNYYVRRIFSPIAHHKVFYDLAFHPKILDAVSNVLGPNVQLHHSKLNLKPPTSREARFEWHQDYPFFPHTNYDLIAVLIHLDDTSEENGCLKVIPGSHKLGPRIHVFAKDGAFSSQLEDKSAIGEESKWLNQVCPAGGVEMHHCNMLHSSTANRGDKPRSVLIFQYRASDNTQLGGAASHFGWGMQVRGENPYQARMLDGSIVKLPGEIKDPLQRDG